MASISGTNELDGLANGRSPTADVNGHELGEITEDDATPVGLGQTGLDAVISQLPQLSGDQLRELSSAVVARLCLLHQEENLAKFVEGFSGSADADFKATQPKLWQSFVTMVESMKIKITEQAMESTSSREGTLTIALPGLTEGVNVTRSRDSFFVNEGTTLLERNEVRVKLGGLDVYSGYWLALDAPSHSIEDPLQEEGIDTLRRVMEAAGLPLSDDVFEDPLEYPFLSALLAPFGPEAALPFENHLRALHSEYGHRNGGCWFKMTSARKARSKLEQVTETDGEEAEEAQLKLVTAARRQMTDAEEAELELQKLDL